MPISLALIQGIITTSEKIGAPIRAELIAAIDRANSVHEKVYALTVGSSALATAVLAALDNKSNPIADRAVQQVITANAISDGIQRQVTDLAAAAVVDTLRDNVDALLESWQEPFNTAAEQIRTAAKTLGAVTLDDTAGILRRGGDAAEQWRIASTANLVIDEIDGMFARLAATTGFASLSRHYLVLRIADPTLEQWEGNSLTERKLSAWDAHRLGLPLSLADRITLPLRIAKLAADREQRTITAMENEAGKRRR